mmetsp:Transcript_8516/g.21169  ORF Transcript_8516/g.21169 Transcript_8516/m.21169 type:complete len:196 (+) Transcript_8516:455-1042(+)
MRDTGVCKHGGSCKFSHEVPKRVCEQWDMTGKCKQLNNCFYVHRYPCSVLDSTGSCRKGSHCSYFHGIFEQWSKTGECKITRCMFVHPSSGQNLCFICGQWSATGSGTRFSKTCLLSHPDASSSHPPTVEDRRRRAPLNPRELVCYASETAATVRMPMSVYFLTKRCGRRFVSNGWQLGTREHEEMSVFAPPGRY